MYKIKFINLYKKSYKHTAKRGIDLSLLDEVIGHLRQGIPFKSKYKDHIPERKFKDFHECHIKPDWSLIYLIEGDILTFTLINTGSHTDLFGM